jgi:hypothetical protein
MLHDYKQRHRDPWTSSRDFSRGSPLRTTAGIYTES